MNKGIRTYLPAGVGTGSLVEKGGGELKTIIPSLVKHE